MPQGGTSSSPRKRKIADGPLEPQPSTSAAREIPPAPKSTNSNRDIVSLPATEALLGSFDNYRLDCYVQVQSIESEPAVFERQLLKLSKQEQKIAKGFLELGIQSNFLWPVANESKDDAYTRKLRNQTTLALARSR